MSERLTDEELAWMSNLPYEGPMIGIPVGTHRLLVSEVCASRELLKRLEWNSPHDGVRCALCLADRMSGERHAPGCALAAAIGSAHPPTEPSE